MPENIEVPSALTTNAPAAPTYIIIGNPVFNGCHNTVSGDVTIQVDQPAETCCTGSPEDTQKPTKWRKAWIFLCRIAPATGQFLWEVVIKPFFGFNGG